VGAENFFLFGLDVEQVREVKQRGYSPREVAEHNDSLREILNFIGSGALAGGDSSLFRPLLDRLLYEDPFLVLADYQAYADCQERVSELWRDERAWTRKTILNVARMGKFSSDRSIREYSEHVWRVKPVKVPSWSTVAGTLDAQLVR
jgi:starch phosphorylase